MKKLFFVCVIVMVQLLTLTSCTEGEIIHTIINTDWDMEIIADIDGTVLITQTKNSDFTGEKFDMDIQFNKNGSFNITRDTDNKSWVGNYTLIVSTTDSIFLEMNFKDGTSAQAVYGERKYDSGEVVPSLTLSTDQYILSFVGSV